MTRGELRNAETRSFGKRPSLVWMSAPPRPTFRKLISKTLDSRPFEVLRRDEHHAPSRVHTHQLARALKEGLRRLEHSDDLVEQAVDGISADDVPDEGLLRGAEPCYEWASPSRD